MGGAQDVGDALNCGALTLAWINATTKVVIGTAPVRSPSPLQRCQKLQTALFLKIFESATVR